MRLPDVVVGGLLEPAWDLRDRSVRLLTLRSLLRSQWLPPERLAALQRERLRRIVRHAAAACPLYAERFAAAAIDPAAVRELSDLARLPLLTKADVRGRAADLFSRRHRRGAMVPARTGGSTGTALEVWCDERGVQRRNGAALRADMWAGWRLGQPWGAVWGNPLPPRSWRERLRRAIKDRAVVLDTMHLDGPAVGRFAREWRGLRPGLLFGHAHSLYLLAGILAERGETLDPPPRAIVATSMMLLRPEREAIERVLGVKVTDRYGCEEVGLIACECEAHAGLHVNSELVAVEALRDDGAPCAPGEPGRIVVTDLVNYGQPLLRYEVGDHGAFAARPCSCGRGLPLLQGLTGRTADFLVAADGALVAGISLIENTLTRLGGIRQMQLVQEERDRLVVHLVRAEGWSDATLDPLTATFRAALGAALRVEVRFVERIPQEPSGKYRFSICRIRP